LSSSTQDTLTVTQTGGRTKAKQESEDEFILNVVASSDVVLRGLNSESAFWEKYEKVGKDGAAREFFTYYVLIRIPETEIVEEQKRLAKIQDFESEKIRNLNTLEQQYDSVKENLKRLDYRYNEAFYNEEFHKLLSISAMINNMRFSDSDSMPYEKHKELQRIAESDLVLFDPQDKQKQVVRTLEDTASSLRIEIDRLKNDHGGVVKEKEIEIQLRDQKILSPGAT
jgi:hypothetical protein